ncbi:DUF2501 domain-containing protein [Dickeya fangzhongdai]|uniref:DUF2501 domain-containing protein n=1 Tax=Dickeya fangzhongdai TaxID=1778540 RepID=A0A2K8QK97_9GAMM|nr:DUF2501 domain-containing protein [Dickeya fangzhongdai]ATZ93904.1 hypothetical protein CVE23_07935 [Dickeya fangzhongdai]MBO8134065.1 DUF2501 domain-containing protein [Dickeya fangzhongdai]QOH47340.1 DUF2501 domain-containing protein [Dickeya fangzhongdai]QOH51646.1 DUF2501 domain-containing protein [Dickeya fangzhongdai]WOY01164.1 DUF2501 domain-containing protein [Dickeya fangzhongdai]
MTLIKRAVNIVGVAALITAASYVQAAGWQDSLSSAASQLSQNGASSGNLSGLTGLLNGETQSLSAGSMNNAAGILQYCLKQKLVSATNTENVKNQLLNKLGLSSQQEQQKQTDYVQGLAGLLNTGEGKQVNLSTLGNTPLAEKVKAKACDIVLKQGVKFLS